MANTTIKDVRNEEMEAVIKELKEYKVIAKQAEDKVKELEGRIKEFMKEIGETNIACGPYTCTYTSVEKGIFNKDIILEEDPELFKKACGTTSYMRLTVK